MVAAWGVGVVVLVGVVAVVVADVVGFDCDEVRTVSLVVVCDSVRVDGSVELLVERDVVVLKGVGVGDEVVVVVLVGAIVSGVDGDKVGVLLVVFVVDDV